MALARWLTRWLQDLLRRADMAVMVGALTRALYLVRGPVTPKLFGSDACLRSEAALDVVVCVAAGHPSQ